MLCDDGTVKIIDFGAARQFVSQGSQSLSVILKQGFTHIEQYQKNGDQGPWTDIYSLGATLYYALTFDTIDDPMSRMEDDTEFQSNKYGIAEPLWEVIRKSVMLKAADRYQDIFLFRNALSAAGIAPQPIVLPKAEPVPIFQTAQPFYTKTENTGSPLPAAVVVSVIVLVVTLVTGDNDGISTAQPGSNPSQSKPITTTTTSKPETTTSKPATTTTTAKPASEPEEADKV